MKLHLPSGLRAALFACFAAFAGIGTTLTTATITGGVFVVTLAGSVAEAADYTATHNTAVHVSAFGAQQKEGGDVVALNSLQAGDTVTFNGISGWFNPAGTFELLADVVLTGDGVTVNDGSTGSADSLKVHNFSGALSGSGNFTRSSNQNYQLYNFSGEVKDFTGTIDIDNSGSVVAFTNGTASVRELNAAYIYNENGSVVLDGGYTVASGITTKNLTVETSTEGASNTTTFNGTVSITNSTEVKESASLVVGANGSLALAGTNTISGSLTNNGTATLTGTSTISGAVTTNGALTLGGTVVLNHSIAIGDAGTLTLSEGLTLDLTGLAFTETDGTYSAALFTGKTDGLTLDGVTLLLEGGSAGKEIALTNGTLSYTVTAASLVCSAPTLDWTVGVDMEGGQFAQNDIVTFTGDTEATLGAAISSAKVTIADGATLSLSNGGVEANTLNTAIFEVNGTLTLKDAALAADTRVTAESAGSVVISGAADATLNFSAQLQDFGGALTVESGRYTVESEKSTPFSSITVVDGGQVEFLSAVGTYAGNITIGGQGAQQDVDFRNSALRAQNVTLSGTVTVAEGGASIAVWGDAGGSETLTITGAVNGDGSLTKLEGGVVNLNGLVSNAGDIIVEGGTLNVAGTLSNGGDVVVNGGSLNLNGAVTNAGLLQINSGTVTIGNALTASNAVMFGQVDIASGAKLAFNHGPADFSHMDINLAEGGTFEVWDSNCGNSDTGVEDPYSKKVTVGRVTVGGDATLRYEWKGVMHLSELTGAGNLSIVAPDKGNDPRATIISRLDNYNGTISGDPDKHDFYLGSAHLDSGDAIIKEVGTINVVDFAKTGAGNLVLVGDVVVSGVLTMNYEGGLYSDEAKTTSGLNITDGSGLTMLTYTAVGDTISLGYDKITAPLVLDLLALADSMPEEGIDLGITGATSADLTALAGKLTVAGYADSDWVLSLGDNQNVFLKFNAGASFETAWDKNWGALEIAQAPATVPAVSDLSGSLVLGDDSTYAPEGAGYSAILITGTAEGGADTVFGGLTNVGQATSRTAELDSWIKMTGGEVLRLVGGNNCSAWQGGSAHYFLGDSHIFVESAGEGDSATTPTVGYIIGGNYKDGYGTRFTGNSYISVASDSVTGAIIGGSSQSHNNASSFIGDSHIYIYTPQTQAATSALGNQLSVEDSNVIVGGNVRADNVSAGAMVFQGDTHIVLDFDGYTGNGTMGKAIIGGSYNAASTATHTGSTNITISNADSATFSKNIVGGSWLGGRTATISGTSTLDISSGTYSAKVIGGHYDTGNASNFSLGGVSMTLSGGAYTGTVIGGNYDGADGSVANHWAIGDIALTVSGTANVTGDIVGGSQARRNNANATHTQGDVTVNLEGGTVGNVYTAGYLENQAKVTTSSTTVNIAAEVTIAADKTVTGGYGGAAANGTVTGDRALNFTSGTTYDKLGNATFKDFDKVSVAAGGEASINLQVAETVTKTGAGTLKLTNELTTGGLVASEGTLALTGASNTLTSLELAGASAVLDVSATQLTMNGSLTLGEGTLKLGADGIALGTDGVLAAVNGTILDLGTIAGEFEQTLFTGVSADTYTTQLGILNFSETEVEGVLRADNVFKVTGLTEQVLENTFLLLKDGKLILSNDAAAGSDWVWTDTADGAGEMVWSNTSADGWKSESGEPNGQPVLFTDTGIGTSGTNTVKISGEVTPASVLVNISAGKSYIFEADGTGSIGGAATLTLKGEGTLELNLANTYTGGTVISGGTLKVGDAAALGTGTVSFDGGKLVYAADVTTELSKIASNQAINVEVADGNTVTWSNASAADGGTIFANGMTLGGTGTLKITSTSATTLGNGDFNISGNLVFETDISGNNIDLTSALKGTGSVTFSAANGAATINGDNSEFAGSIVLRNNVGTGGTDAFLFLHANAAGGEDTTLVLDGACIRGEGDGYVYSAGTVEVKGSNVINGGTWGNATSYEILGDLTGSGTLAVQKASTMTLSGSLTGFTGTLTNNLTDAAVTVVFGKGDAYAGTTIFGDGAVLTSKDATTVAPIYSFNYSSDATMNATVSGVAALAQNGTGKLTLTQDNTSTGALTVNSGTVAIGAAGDAASWAGDMVVKGTGVLEIVSVTGNAVTGGIEAESTATVKVTGATAAGETVTLSSVKGGNLETTGSVTLANPNAGTGFTSLTNSGTLKVDQSMKVTSLTNTGAIELATGQGLTIEAGTTAGGDISADQILVGGDSSFGSVTVTSGLRAQNNSIELNGDSTLSSLVDSIKDFTVNAAVGVTSGDVTVTGQLAGSGSLDTAGNVSLNGTGAHSLGGNLSMNGTLALSGSLDVGGTLDGVDVIKFNGNGLAAPNGPLPGFGAAGATGTEVSVDTLDVTNGKLTLQFKDDSMIESLGLRNNHSYTLVAADTAILSGGLALSDTNVLDLEIGVEGATGALSDTYEIGSNIYSVSVDGNNIILTAKVGGTEWTDIAGEDGTWSGSDYSGSSVPTASQQAAFLGAGPETVTIDDVTVGKIVVDTTNTEDGVTGYDTSTYTYAGEELTTGGLVVSAGGLVLNNETTSVQGADASDPDTADWTGNVVVGDVTDPNGSAKLTVGADSTLVAGSLTVNNDGGFVNEGTTEIAGAVEAAYGLTNTGDLTVGTGTDIASVSGTADAAGTVTVAGDDVSLGDVTFTSSLAAVDTNEGATPVGVTAGVVDLSGVTGETTSVTSDNSTMTITSAAGVDTLGASNAGSLTVTQSVAGASEITAASGAAVTVEGDVTMADDGQKSLSATGTGSTLGVDGAATGVAVLSAQDGAVVDVATLTDTADAGVTVALGDAGSRVSVGNDLKVTSYTSATEGLLQVGGHLAVDLAGGAAVTDGGLVQATSVSLNSVEGTDVGHSFEGVRTQALTLDVSNLSMATGSNALLTVGATGLDTVVTPFGLFDDGVAITLTGIAGISDPTAAGADMSYVNGFLNADGTLKSDSFTLISATDGGTINVQLAESEYNDLRQLFAIAGIDATLTETTTALTLNLSLAGDRNWNSNDPNWAGNSGDVTGTTDPTDPNSVGIDLTPGRNPLGVAYYDRFDTVQHVNLKGTSATDTIDISLVGEVMDASKAGQGLIIRDLNGTGTLNLTGDGVYDAADLAAGDLVTILNTNAGQVVNGGLQATDITVQLRGEAAGDSLTVNSISLTDAALNIQTNGDLTSLGATALSGSSALTVEAGAALSSATAALAGSSTLTVQGDGSFVATGDVTLSSADARLEAADAASVLSVGALKGSVGEIAGTILVTGTGGNYSGSYDAANVRLAANGASQALAVGSGLSLSTAAGVTNTSATLAYTGTDTTMESINVAGTNLTLSNINATTGEMNTLSVTSTSSIEGGSLAFGVKVADVVAGVHSAADVPVIMSGDVNISGTMLKVTQVDKAVTYTSFDISKGTEGLTLMTLVEGGSADLTVANIDFANSDFFSSAFFQRYFDASSIKVENGQLKADLVTDYYTSRLALSENGTTGMEMLDAAALELNPQGNPQQFGDLAGVLNALDEHVATGNSAAADRLAAAVAGSGVASLGMAIAGDVERQLKAIRNRTTTMGVDPSVVNEDMPYFNAWINAEGDHRSLDADGTLAGYTMNSWGGTVGFDVDVNPSLTFGLAITAMYGDFSAEAADVVEGDVDSYYLSAFARATTGAWVHTFVATVGMSRADLDRTVSHSYGSYTTKGETDGMSFGALYEIGRTYALNEDATACWQPVVNVAYRHTQVEGYKEDGGDAALTVGDQSLDTVTFGIGGRVQAVVGENIYNRTSVFEARALAKFDIGDRASEMSSALLNSSAAKGTVKSAEMDAFGIEVGAGLTVPVGMESGSIFLDGSVEFRGSYINANGTLGYRINF